MLIKTNDTLQTAIYSKSTHNETWYTPDNFHLSL